MKKCGKCKATKSETKFYASKRPSGLQSWCKECQHESKRNQKERQAEWQRNNRKKIVAYVREKKSAPCTDCGIQYAPHIMQFDHLDASMKSYTIGSITQKVSSFDTIDREIAKCEIVCANCHADRTYKRKQKEQRSD